MAAFGSMLAFGSFGVPIKSEAARSVDVDPLVFQTYKTAMCFATSWLILLTGSESFTFTPWGIVSGLFWVPGYVDISFLQNADFSSLKKKKWATVLQFCLCVNAISLTGII